MNSLEFTKPIRTESLLKEFESRFNMTMDLSKFERRRTTRLRESRENKDTRDHTEHTLWTGVEDNSYQKSPMMLDVINQAIKRENLASTVAT